MAEAQAESRVHALIALPQWQALVVDGIDAGRFLQAQLASDVAALAPGRWQWSCWLNAQGRVHALFLLLREGDTRYLLLLPGSRADALRLGLARYVLRSKLVLTLDAGLAVALRLGPAAATPPASGGALHRDRDHLRLSVGGARSREFVLGQALPDAVIADATTLDAVALADVADGIPWIAAEVAENWIPQALALDRLAAYSVQKGCYPGQEIVARTHFLGRNKRLLRRIDAVAGPLPPPGTRLMEPGRIEAAGEIVLAARAGDGLAALAVLHEDCGAELRTEAGGAGWRVGAALQRSAN